MVKFSIFAIGRKFPTNGGGGSALNFAFLEANFLTRKSRPRHLQSRFIARFHNKLFSAYKRFHYY